jgi:pimeloyl-ACP methyl ester carboxylesterase
LATKRQEKRQTPRFAVWPSGDSPVSLRSWIGEVRELARAIASPPPFPSDAAKGQGRPVLVIPGFCSPDISTARLRDFLAHQEFTSYAWDLGINIGPTRTILQGLERKLSEIAEKHGAPGALIGQSLGGTIAREIAKRRPDLVSHVVTLVSPIRVPVPTPLAPLARFASLVWDEEARQVLSHISEPPDVPLTAIITPRDGLVDWRYCKPDPAPNVEVVVIDGAHSTMGSNPEAQRIVADRLAPK